MAFVKVRDNNKVESLVIFNSNFKELIPHKVYIMKLNAGRIVEFKEASKIEGS